MIQFQARTSRTSYRWTRLLNTRLVVEFWL